VEHYQCRVGSPLARSWASNQGVVWAEVEGKVTQVVPEGDGLRLELGVGLARMTVEVADAAGESPALLMNRIVRVESSP